VRVESCLVSDVSDGALIMALLTRGLTSFLKCFTYKLPILTPVVLLQFCRYLFYLGKIRTIQLEYTDAKESLLQAARKAPVSALGFRVQCNKWAVIVRLLLGEIPERTVFMQKGMEKALRPYFELTNVSIYIPILESFILVSPYRMGLSTGWTWCRMLIQ
jgi:hypothetical protein